MALTFFALGLLSSGSFTHWQCWCRKRAMSAMGKWRSGNAGDGRVALRLRILRAKGSLFFLFFFFLEKGFFGLFFAVSMLGRPVSAHEDGSRPFHSVPPRRGHTDVQQGIRGVNFELYFGGCRGFLSLLVSSPPQLLIAIKHFSHSRRRSLHPLLRLYITPSDILPRSRDRKRGKTSQRCENKEGGRKEGHRYSAR
ncbi:hypothetical protein BDY21DRAFT_77449 [Lineolata rhizophorae]|uniref:Uncharacterized protein n=1 Tax=Lineolata rhizophorae TaxID=578093 RepID=A0A6A6NU65_9PEZI|nr:hypothetical protein BDY21DRAFT_77449 [Lineolata rhizophorae]